MNTPNIEEIKNSIKASIGPIKKILLFLLHGKSYGINSIRFEYCEESYFLKDHKIFVLHADQGVLPNHVPPASSYGVYCLNSEGTTRINERGNEVSNILRQESVDLEKIKPEILAMFYNRIWLENMIGDDLVIKSQDDFCDFAKKKCQSMSYKVDKDIYEKSLLDISSPKIVGSKEIGWKLTYTSLIIFENLENELSLESFEITSSYKIIEKPRIKIARNLFVTVR